MDFTIDEVPVPASRPRVGRHGTYYPKKHLAAKKALDELLSVLAPKNPIKVPVELRIKSVMPRYKTSDHPVHRSDVDNLAKLPMDCMTYAKFWEDDDLVVGLKTYKRFVREGEEPHIEFKVIPLGEVYADYVDRSFEESYVQEMELPET